MARCPYRNKDYRTHFAAHRREMLSPQHDYDGRGPIYSPPHWRATRVFQWDANKRHKELIRYAAAMGKTWGQLPDDLSHFQAYAVRHDDGIALVSFTECKRVDGQWSRLEPIGEAIHVRALPRLGPGRADRRTAV